jgi:hypothetical protein
MSTRRRQKQDPSLPLKPAKSPLKPATPPPQSGIFRRKDRKSRWYARIRIQRPDGTEKKIVRAARVSTTAAAETFLKLLKRQLEKELCSE